MHDLGLRAQSPLNVGKVESNEVFCRAVEEEEGSKKLVESLLFAAVEMMMSNQGVDYVIEKKKTNYVIVVFNKVEADNKLEVVLYYSIMTWLYVTPFHFNVMDQPDDLTLVRLSRSGAMTAIGTARRSLTARRSMYSAPIAVTIAVTSRSGAMTAIAPL
ncbi:hypothetical protein L249_7079 [Ophiocordyceps polyrhachis-furcata BCC 54312]|uniref:Uncharacterized protein n=1 Tax=Ophiocordyceps polyrhachis-furcata BCC 54312 TaxID=1330021 RepID=A0A367LK25_9HYPO|nr:hypothetical protein L249_7079 [Ophiocordyceps polyrhachis-furcata BCC 54312]